jgi:calcineurin-like phosphoesterase family protein
MNIFFTSDLHWGHKNIVKGCSDWSDLSRCRDFATLKEHNATIINNINKVVGHDDIMYCLGDWSFGGDENIWKFRRQIHCQTIHFVGGNHDHHIRRNKILTTDSGLVNARALFTSYHELFEKKIAGKYDVVFCHYRLATWHKAKKGAWMLHGHSHGCLKDTPYKVMDVGIDCHPEFRPFHLEEVKSFMNTKTNLGHHEHEE